MKVSLADLSSLQRKVEIRVNQLQEKVLDIWGTNVSNIEIAYDLHTIRLGGQAVVKKHTYKMRLHPAALLKYKDQYINDIVVHEYAHLVQLKLYPNSKPHGREWKQIMRFLGADPNRCHKFNLDKALEEFGAGKQSQRRKRKTFTYKCNCNEYQLSSIRHNRVVSGKQTYFCKKCKQTLELK